MMLFRVHMWNIWLNKQTHTDWLGNILSWYTANKTLYTGLEKLSSLSSSSQAIRLHRLSIWLWAKGRSALLSCSCIIWHQSHLIVQKAVAHMDGQYGALDVVQWRKALMKGRRSNAKEYLKLGQNQSEHDCLLTHCSFVISWLGFRHTLVLCLGWAGSAG